MHFSRAIIRKEIRPGVDSGYIKVFLHCLITAGLMIVPFIIQGKGIFTLVDDFNYQQIPFNMQSNEAIKSGNIFWNWYMDLGSNFIGAFSFYTLGSPFFWLSLLFPASFFPYLIGPFLILKYCVAGLTAYAYIKRYVVNSNAAVIGALLYAFSGFSTVNLMFNHFHDVIALFPLLLIGLDRLMLDKKKGFFAAVVALSALLNYFFFVGEAVFIMLYLWIRFFAVDIKKYIRFFPGVIFEAVIGTGMACFLLLPSLFFTMDNPRTNAFLYGSDSIVFDGNRYLMIIKSLLFPADIMPDQSAITSTDFTSSSAYLSLFGISLVVAFILSEKNWMATMVKVCALIACVPVLNSLFYALNAHYYARWFYMPVLIMAMISAIVLDRFKAYPVKKSVLITIIMTVSFTVYLMCYPWKPDVIGAVIHIKLFFIYAVIAVGSLILLYMLFSHMDRFSKWFPVMLVAVIGTSVILGWINIYKMKSIKPLQTSEDIYNQVIRSGNQLNNLLGSQPYRINTTSVNHNLSLTSDQMSVSSFSSTINGSIFEFYSSIGHPRSFGIFTEIPKQYYALKPLLSEKYHLDFSSNGKEQLYASYNNGSNVIHIYENKDVLPLGFTYDYYVTDRQFKEIPEEKRHLLLLKAVVIADEKINDLDDRLKPLPDKQFRELDDVHFDQDLKNRSDESSYFFQRDRTGFSSKIYSDGPKIAFFSVPFDRGWDASVNGRPVKITESSGLMTVPVEKGENVIRFDYLPPGLKTGSLITLFSVVLYLLHVIVNSGSIKRKLK